MNFDAVLLLFLLALHLPSASSLCVMYSCVKTIYEGLEDFRCENFPFDRCLSASDCGGHCDNIPDHKCTVRSRLCSPLILIEPNTTLASLAQQDNRECLIPAPTPFPVSAPMPTGSVCWWASQADAEQCESLGGGTGVCYGSERSCHAAGGGQFLGQLCGNGGECGCCMGWPTPPPSPQPTRRPETHPSRQPTFRPSLRPTRKPDHGPTPKPTWWPTAHPTPHPAPEPTRCCPQFALTSTEIFNIFFAVCKSSRAFVAVVVVVVVVVVVAL